MHAYKVVKHLPKQPYYCNLPHDCSGNFISWKFNPTIRAAIPSNSMPNPTPSSGRGTTQQGGKWSNYDVDAALFIGGSGFIYRRNGKTICNGRIGGFAPNPIRHWRKQLIPRQGGCSGKNTIANMDTPGSAITLSNKTLFSGNYTAIYINKTLSIQEQCDIKGGVCMIQNHLNQSRPIMTYSRDYHSSSNTYLQSRGKLFYQQNAINFKKLRSFPCKKQKKTAIDYNGLYNTDVSGCFFTDGSCVVALVYDPVNAVFGTNTAVAGSLYAQNRAQTTLTQNQYNIINRWGLDSVSITKIYPLVRTLASGYRKLNGGTGTSVICCPAFVEPPFWSGNGFFQFALTDTLWTQIRAFRGSDFASCPVVSNTGQPLPVTIEPNYDKQGNTRVTVEYHYLVGDPANSGFTMAYLLNALISSGQFPPPIMINIIQWGGIPLNVVAYSIYGTMIFSSGDITTYNSWGGQIRTQTLTHDQLPIRQWNSPLAIDTPLIRPSALGMDRAFINLLNLTGADLGNINDWDMSAVTYTYRMFNNCFNLDVDLGGWDTHNFHEAGNMFENCASFTGKGLNNWDVTGMNVGCAEMLSGCAAFNADLGNWDVSNFVNASGMFQNCTSFQGVGLSYWRWSVTHPFAIESLFNGCEILDINNDFDISGWNMTQCASICGLFYNCRLYRGRGIPIWNTTNIKAMNSAFANCEDFNQDLSGWNITGLNKNLANTNSISYWGTDFGHGQAAWVGFVTIYMFDNCISLSVKNITSTLVGWGKQTLPAAARGPSGATNGGGNTPPYGGATTTTLPLGMLNVTYYTDKYGVNVLQNSYNNWSYVGAIETHVVPTYLTGLTDWRYAYHKSRGWPANTIGADPSNIPIPPAYPTISGDYIVPQSDFSLWASDASSVTNMSYMFADCSGFPGTGCQTWNTTKLVTATGMFQRCVILNLNFSGWNTSALQNTAYMFNDCSAFQGIGLSSWNTGNLVTANNMFKDCSNLVSIDTSTNSWNVAKCQDFSGMFLNCPKYVGYGLPYWNTSSATSFASMFKNDVSFNTDVSRWTTNKVATMNSMFTNCSTFNQDISGWSIRSLRDASGMLNYTAMSTQNYTNLLYKWGRSSYIQRTVPLGANNCYYYHDAVAPKNNLVTNYKWIITDLGPTPPFPAGLVTSMSNNWSRMFLGSVGQATNLAAQPFPAPIPGIAIVSGSEFSHWDASMVTNTIQMFQDCSSFMGWGLDTWKTSNIQYFTKMFQGCADFSQNFGGWIVTSGISMDSMFSGCLHWLGTGVSNWHPTRAKTMSNMFNGCTIFNQDLSGWRTDISLVTTMNSMFQNCSSFTGNSAINTNNTSLKLWDTSSVTDMSGMFQNATVFNQDLSWNISSVTTTTRMFQNAAAFNGNIRNFNTINNTSMNSMFQGATTFNQDISGWNTSKVTTMNTMFKGASSFNKNIGYWDTSNVQDMSGMFQNAAAFNQDLSGFKISSLQNAVNMLSGTGMSTQNYTLLLKNWGQAIKSPRTNVSFGAQGIKYYQWAKTGRTYLTTTKAWNISDGGLDSAQIGLPPSINLLTDWSYMFPSGVGSTTNPFYVDVSGYIVTGVSNFSTWIANNVTNFNSMFQNCSLFTGIGLPLWNTVSAINMGSMFQNCALFNQDLSGWTTTGVLNMASMFQNCSVFNQNLQTWDTSNVQYMNSMFQNCSAFLGTNLNNWKTGNVLTMANMFQTCPNFNSNISKWNTSNVANMSAMFQDCSAFNQDLSGWNIASLTNATNMLNNTIMSPLNYSKLLIRWAAQAPTIHANVVFGAAGLTYNYNAASSHDILTNLYNWIITDAGQTIFSMPTIIGTLTDWSYMFYNGVGSTINTNFIDVSGFPLSLTTDFTLWYPTIVTNFTAMFQNTPLWQGIGLPIWDTPNGTTMTSMFQNCPTFNQDLSGWIIQNVTSLKNMFSGCTAFNANLSTWDISNVIDASGMLDNCGMSSQNYSLILYFWAYQAPNIRPNVTFGAQGLLYFPWADSSKAVLTGAPYNWIITDGGHDLIQIGYPPTINQIIDWSNMFNGGQG